jgi:hypothetical protein
VQSKSQPKRPVSRQNKNKLETIKEEHIVSSSSGSSSSSDGISEIELPVVE